MEHVIPAWQFSTALLFGMLICLEIGRRLARGLLAKDPSAARSDLGRVETAIFGLYALLLALTLTGAPARFDTRRQLIAQEANAISTAYLRLDLLAAESQPVIRERFRNYLDSRLEAYRKFPDIEAATADAERLVLPTLNEMLDVAVMRTMAARIHPPAMIFGLLFLLALVCSITSFVVVTVVSVFVVLDIEYPRLGLIRLDHYDQVLVELRQSMD